MTSLQINDWSEALRQRTRDTIEQTPMTRDDRVHFKHLKLGYAYATLDDLIQERLILQAQTSTESYRFEAVEALLQAGWVVD
jgi:hypothetical protein